MDRESLPPGVDPLALRPALSDLCRVLESLREGLSAGARPATPSLEIAAVQADTDVKALGIVQELLGSPALELPPNDLFTIAIDRASRLLAADRAMVLVAEAGGSRLVPHAAHGFRKEDLTTTSVRPGEGIIGRVFKEGRVLAHPGASGGAPDTFIERYPVREAIAVPVRVDDEVAGVLYVGKRQPSAPFSASDMLLLLVIADRVGDGLFRRTLLDRRARQIARLAELGRVAGQCLSVRPLREVLAALCEAGCRLVDVSAVVVAVEAGPDELALVAACGLPAVVRAKQRVSTRGGVTASLYAGEEFVACRDVQERRIPERSFLGEGGFRGCLLLPLDIDGAPAAGVLYLADARVRDFSEEEIEGARVLAAMAASAIRNSHADRDPGGASAGETLIGDDRKAQVEKARALGEMASGLARELNNVFAIILGKSRLLLARTTNESLREGLATLEEAGWRGADVVHRLMALATPASREALGPVDMAALVRDVITLTQPRWKGEPEEPGGGIDVIADLQGVPAVHGSESALREMLVNVVLNAVDAMATGGRLTLSTRPREDGVEVVIEDTGEGISEDVRGRAFDAFFTTRSPKRMGLGLTVAQGVIVRHGGWIDIGSVPRSGTRVTVWLPAARTVAAPAPLVMAHEARAVREPMAAPPDPGQDVEAFSSAGAMNVDSEPGEAMPGSPGSGLQGVSILVLEDEAAVRSLLVQALTDAGYTVETAVDGLSGLAKLDRGPFDVVVTDLALPQRSGLAIARAVKRLSPRTPVVLITGWAHHLDPERLRQHGVDRILVKPFRSERALSVVGDALHLGSGS